MLRERLTELEKKRDALIAQIRSASIRLDRRYRQANVAENGANVSAKYILPFWLLFVLMIAFLSHVSTLLSGLTLGDLALALGVALVMIVLALAFFIRWLKKTRKLPDRPFDPSRYVEATAPTHLLAEHKLLDRDRAEVDALDAEIEEAEAFIAAQEQRGSR
jgi:hypothetical protein